MADIAGPQAADWLLATEDGQTHRFRDLTTLQKWVVERKATREDRVSQRGGPWLPLGEVDELAPFFEVVDQADRARSAAHPPDRGRRSAQRAPDGLATRQTPTRQTAIARPGGARRRANGLGAEDALSARVDSAPTPSLDPGDFPSEEAEKFETMTIFRNRRGLKIAGVAGFVALAVAAALIGFRRPEWTPTAKPTESARTSDRAPDRTSDRTPGPSPSSAAVPPPGPAAPAPRAAASGVHASAPPVAVALPPATPPLPAAPPAGAKGLPGADLALPAKPKTYERLVADADRLMENGQPMRAQKLLDEALAMQPNGVAALSGVAYLYLDRQKPLAAISTFKRALGYSPEFAPALFGLAEAYRAQGEIGPAAENYRKYIGVAPGGPDANAARRQLKEIESLMPKRPPAQSPSPAKESAKGDDSPAPATTTE